MSEHHLRTLLQLTQRELALILNIHKSAVVHVERGRRSFSKNSNKVIQKFMDVLYAKIHPLGVKKEVDDTKEVKAIREAMAAASSSTLKKDIKNYQYRLAFNQRALMAMKENYELLIQSLERLHRFREFPESFDEIERDWIELQILLNKKKLRTYSPEKQHQLQLRLAEIEAGLAMAKELVEGMEGNTEANDMK